MRFALLALSCCDLVTALTEEDALVKWGGPRGGGKVSHGGNNVGNGDGGGIGIDTGGGDIGDIGVGVGGGCDPAACDAKVRFVVSEIRGSIWLLRQREWIFQFTWTDP
ncbi:hypothetical protein N7481_010384 [Penicillium waksmanii]|uniref:uncharacterized protein n=1 Tax=Penicillium waksmanii TaxID=69791 RepID=UPI00254885DB|nr:uncharacterized protein N7481_010384 [Penicillium waksmanii]KAJ5973174.1 hypothetical protein N7481_010384 [Penicillium waksmanii]